jgi:hypothetical protein
MKKVTRLWVRKAENDVAAARQLLKARPLLNDEICFHCQQAIEKYFKGLLAEHGLPIQKCPLPGSDRIFWRMLPNWRPRGRCWLHREFGEGLLRLCCRFWRDTPLFA